MKNTKIILSFLLAAAMLLSLAACGEESLSSSETQRQNSESAVQAMATQAAAETDTDTDAEPAEPNSEYITSLLSTMSLEEKIGQMFFVSCPGDAAEEFINSYHPGGFLMFAKDFEGKTADEVKSVTESYTANSKIPMLIGVDEEGGDVVRVSSNPNLSSTEFLSPKEYYKSGGMDAVINAETEKAALLLSLGINVNLAPVCDVTSDENSFMYSRSFSSDADEVSDFVTNTVDVYKTKKLGSVLKHFPGYGDNTDTHTGAATDNRSYTELVNNDFKPFEAGIKAGADAILVSHNTVTSIDPDYPASLSDKVHQVIRQDLNFKGVIMTDDLGMGAVGSYQGDENSAVLAVKGGNDLICTSDFSDGYEAVYAAVKNGEIPIEQIDQSVTRILKWKQNLGFLSY